MSPVMIQNSWFKLLADPQILKYVEIQAYFSLLITNSFNEGTRSYIK